MGGDFPVPPQDGGGNASYGHTQGVVARFLPHDFLKGHFPQHRSQMCVWCNIFSSRVSLKLMNLFYEANTVSIRPVFHELYEKKLSKKNIHSKSFFFNDIDLKFTKISQNRLVLYENSK